MTRATTPPHRGNSNPLEATAGSETNERAIDDPSGLLALPSQAQRCYAGSMATEEPVLDAAKRIKAKMESYGYTPTIEEVVASVEYVRGRDLMATAKRINTSMAFEGFTGRSVEDTARNLAEDREERCAWVHHLMRKAKAEGRTDRDVNREYRIKVLGRSFSKAMLRVV